MDVNNIKLKNNNINILTKKNMALIILFYSILMLIILSFVNSIIGLNKVISGSMKNTLLINEFYLRNKVAYKFTKKPIRGEIIDFINSETKELYVKRVIGLPNEIIYINNGIVYINNEKIKENYIINNNYKEYGPYKIPENEYFVLGDNRSESNDSRFWNYPFVKKEDIKGKVICTINKENLKVNILKTTNY